MRAIFSSLAVAAIAALAPAVTLAGEQEDKAAAEQIATLLRDSGQMQNYSVGVKYKNGTVWLSGKVANDRQLQAALQVVSDIEGVQQIVNNMSVASKASGGLKQPLGSKSSARRTSATSADSGQSMLAGGAEQAANTNGEATPAGYQRLAARRAARLGPSAAVYAQAGGNSGVQPAAYDQPHMPNYAWPSYAAHPNYAAVTYPKQYSPTAWPFIGPFYPYPQVPLGWRKVSLEWDDGWWFLDFQDRNHH
jgi:hypothetical protein